MSFKFTAPILRISSEFQRNPLTHTPYQWGRKALQDYWLKGFFQSLLNKGILNFADWILYFVSVRFLCSKLNVLIYSALLEWMYYCLPCLHLKNRKVNEGREVKALHHSFSHLKETGIKKFLTIRNPLAGLRKEKARKARTAICRLI